MNTRGSYRALLSNSKAAMMAAIEIYNKPQISYRDESFSILLINAWELLAKAILSKNRQRIFYPKERKKPYRTFSLKHAFMKTKRFFPKGIPHRPVWENIKAIEEFRDNAIHFYNQSGFGVIIYGLAQTSIVNFREILQQIFGFDIADEMTINILPLAYGVAPDPIEFLRKSNINPPKNKIVAQYLQNISLTTKQLEDDNIDTARFITVFTIHLISEKKISSTDITVGIKGSPSETDTKIIEKKIDPNETHPLRRKDVLKQIGSHLKGLPFTGYTTVTINWKYKIKENKRYFWRGLGGGASQYSRDYITFLKNLSANDITTAQREYRAYRNQQRREKNKTKKE